MAINRESSLLLYPVALNDSFIVAFTENAGGLMQIEWVVFATDKILFDFVNNAVCTIDAAIVALTGAKVTESRMV